MKTVIAGSRDIELYEVVRYAINLNKIDITEVISGTARGVDKLGERYAQEYGIPIKRFKPDYEQYPKNVAPLKRNAQMGAYGEAAIIIWDGESNGSRHMMKCMEAEGKPYILVKIKLDYIRYLDTIVRTYEFSDGAKFVEFPDGQYKSNVEQSIR